MVKYVSTEIQTNWPKKKRERTLGDAPATGRTMKGHLTVASHGDLRCCVKYIRRFSFLFVSSPFFLFLRRPTIVISYWPWSIGSLTAIGGWCNGSWCFDGCDASWWAACWPVLRCDGWFGRTPSRSRVTKDRIVRAFLNTLHRRINTGNNYCVHSREQHYRHIYVTIQL